MKANQIDLNIAAFSAILIQDILFTSASSLKDCTPEVVRGLCRFWVTFVTP